MGASGKVVVGLVVDGVGNSNVDADNIRSGLRGGMGSCRHTSVGRCGSNRSSSNIFINSSSSSNIFIDSSSSNRTSSSTFGNSSSYYSLTIPLIMHRPNGGSGGHFIVVLTLLGGTRRNRPPPPNSPMGSVYQCKRCGRLGHMAQICTTPQRFEGACNSCGQYGHRHHNCITNKYHTHAHANVISYPSGFNWGGSGNMPWPRQQQQHLMVNGPMPWPQQDPQQQQPQQQLISYDSDGGWVRGDIDCGAGVPPPSGNGGDCGGQQRYIGGHGSSDGSGGGNSSGGNGDNGDSGVDIGGGDDGYNLVAGGSDPPPNWVVGEQQDGRNYAEDDSGPLAGTFETSQDFSAENSIIFRRWVLASTSSLTLPGTGMHC